MIERHVYIRLAPEYRDERQAMAQRAQQVLATIPGVESVRVATPADEDADKAWDLGLFISFASLDAVLGYRIHPVHRRYVDEELAPRMEVIKAWNFEVSAG